MSNFLLKNKELTFYFIILALAFAGVSIICLLLDVLFSSAFLITAAISLGAAGVFFMFLGFLIFLIGD